ncbi:DUF456 domain-containing protein [Brachybacterium hainanense]|uniref:DUF456 domain-containing protein n=1 Tax=Brachybacterium hainanense TaxID=1541174 RepID=A0ABV6RDM3_9MICO
MAVDIIVTVLAALAYIVALTGIIVPVLPGTITYVIATLIWAIVIGGPEAWIAFGLVLLFGAAGMATSYVLTGRKLKAHEVPTWPILVGIAAGIVGIFVIPFLGLPIGFLIGLYVSESLRLKDWRNGLSSTWVAVKALGIGIMIELGLAFCATIAFAVAATVHFVTL